MERCFATAPRASHSSAHCWEVPSVSPFPHHITQAPLSGTHQELFPVECPHSRQAWKLFRGDMSKRAMLMGQTTQERKCCWAGWQVTVILAVGGQRQAGQLFKASLSYMVGVKPFWVTWDVFSKTNKRNTNVSFVSWHLSYKDPPYQWVISKKWLLENSDSFFFVCVCEIMILN